MTDRRSFLAKLLCLPAALKAAAAASPLPEMSPYKMFYDAMDYTGEFRWIYQPDIYSSIVDKSSTQH